MTDVLCTYNGEVVPVFAQENALILRINGRLVRLPDLKLVKQSLKNAEGKKHQRCAQIHKIES